MFLALESEHITHTSSAVEGCFKGTSSCLRPSRSLWNNHPPFLSCLLSSTPSSSPFNFVLKNHCFPSVIILIRRRFKQSATECLDFNLRGKRDFQPRSHHTLFTKSPSTGLYTLPLLMLGQLVLTAFHLAFDFLLCTHLAALGGASFRLQVIIVCPRI